MPWIAIATMATPVKTAPSNAPIAMTDQYRDRRQKDCNAADRAGTRRRRDELTQTEQDPEHTRHSMENRGIALALEGPPDRLGAGEVDTA